MTYRYDPVDLRAQWIRVGLAVTATIILLAAAFDSAFAVTLCLAFFALIAAYAIDLILKRHTDVTVDETCISLTTTVPWISKRPLRARRIAWSDLKDVRLRFFPTRRDREIGWFELTVKGGATTIKIQSQLLRFDELLEEVFRRAREADVLIPETTEHNLGYFKRKPSQGIAR